MNLKQHRLFHFAFPGLLLMALAAVAEAGGYGGGGGGEELPIRWAEQSRV